MSVVNGVVSFKSVILVRAFQKNETVICTEWFCGRDQIRSFEGDLWSTHKSTILLDYFWIITDKANYVLVSIKQ